MDQENKVTPATVARTVILFLALLNQLLYSTGHPIINLDDETLTTFITLGFTVITSILGFWKNNSFTKKAIKADKTFKK